jgi:hypothetical protein
MQECLLHLEKAVMWEFTNPFPVSKIDLFEVYLACIQIISIISDKMHDDKVHGINCVCFAEALLTAADHYKTIHISCNRWDVRSWWRLAMKDVLGNRKLDGFCGRTFDYEDPLLVNASTMNRQSQSSFQAMWTGLLMRSKTAIMHC